MVVVGVLLVLRWLALEEDFFKKKSTKSKELSLLLGVEGT